jgi:uncharacterized protein
MSLNPKIAIVTGASGGIGEKIALALAKEYGELIVTGRNAEALARLKSQIQSASPSTVVRAVISDLSKAVGCQKIIDDVPRADLLVNNAGFAEFGPLLDSPLSRQLEMVDVNCSAAVRLSHHYGKIMSVEGAGIIVNIGSLASFMSVPYMTLYAATKAFLVSFGEGLDYELRGKGVRVITVCPGGVDTQFHIHSGLPDAIALKFKRFLASPDDVAAMVVKVLRKKPRIKIVGFVNVFSYVIQKFLPRSFSTNLAGRMYSQFLK